MIKSLGKISLLIAAVGAVLGFGTAVLGQSIGVSPKKVVYRRPKPEAKFKRTFSITYPRISGVPPHVRKKIESVLDYEKIFEFTVEQERTDVQWLEEAFYKVDLNRGGILSVTLIISGSGAYPSTSVKHISVDTTTGDKIILVDEIKYGAQDALLGRLDGLLKAEVAKYTKLYKDPRYEVEDPATLFGEGLGFTLENVEDFTVGAWGITFNYDYGFPHVIQALQPPGRFFLPWSEMRNYIKDSSVFRRLSK